MYNIVLQSFLHNLGIVQFCQDCGGGLFSSFKWTMAGSFRAHALVTMSNDLTLLHNIVICKDHTQNHTSYQKITEAAPEVVDMFTILYWVSC